MKFDCWDIKKQLLEFSNQNNVSVKILSEDEKAVIFQKVKKKYIREKAKIGYSIFEALKYEYVGTDVADSWKWLEDFIKNKSIIVFFNDSEEKNCYEFDDGKAFVDFYNNIPLIEFYIVDVELTYLLAYNHSQCLVAMGKAADWLEKYKKCIQ